MSFENARDDRERVISNVHLKGLFHRICKLLYFNIRPVFVFDGAVPDIKRRTVVSSCIGDCTIGDSMYCD
jgi:hypothetical protein